MRGAVPAIRLKATPESDFPSWTKKLLGQITKWSSGGTPSKDVSEYWVGDIPWVSALAMHHPKVHDAPLNVSESAIGRGTRITPMGSVLILVRGSMLYNRIPVCMAMRDLAFNQDVKSLICDKSIIPLFLFYWLSAKEPLLKSMVTGTGIGAGKLETSEMQGLTVHLPTLPEQQKIAAFLGAVDGRLAGLRRAEAGLVRFKAGLMQRLFSQKLRFKQDDGSAFPDWEEKRLGDLVTWQRNNNLSREFASETEGEVQNIHYGDIHGRFSNLFRQAEADAPFIACHAPIKNFKLEDYCRVGDIIFADASEDHADIGKAIELIEVQDNSIVSGLHTHLARPHADTFALGFVGYMMRVYSVRKQIMTAAQGISVLGISKGNLGAVIVPYPHPDEQRKIAAALSALDAKITATRAQISQTERFKQGLLQQMFV